MCSRRPIERLHVPRNTVFLNANSSSNLIAREKEDEIIKKGKRKWTKIDEEETRDRERHKEGVQCAKIRKRTSVERTIRQDRSVHLPLQYHALVNLYDRHVAIVVLPHTTILNFQIVCKSANTHTHRSAIHGTRIGGSV